MEFSGLLGNEALKNRLSASFQAGKHSHCYLICGPEGSGRKTLASLMARALQCEEQGAPCMRCNTCRKIGAGIHPDVITMDDTERKTIPVDLIRRMQEDAFVHPNEGKRKIYLIPRAQDMTENAQNALLKLVEEPPSYAVFLLLTTNADRLLPTVRSRSVQLRMEPVSFEQSLGWLREHCPEQNEQSLRAAHLRCGGFLGQVLEYLQAERELPQTTQFAQAFSQNDRFALTMLLCSMEKMPRDQLHRCLSQWKMSLTEAIAYRSGMPCTPDAQLLGQRRTAQDLALAAEKVQKAMEYCNANIGAGHICGTLAASL